MSTQDKADKLRAELAQFYGSETIYRHHLNRNVVYTEGVQHFAKHAGNGAYWFLDILATEPFILVEALDFAHVTLTVADGRAVIRVTDGGKNANEPLEVFRREIDFTDCPPGTWEFYFENLTIILPGEH